MGEAEVEEVEPEVVAEAEEVVAVAEVNVVEAEVEEAVSVEVVAAEVVVAEAEAVALEEDTLAEAIVTLRTRLFPTNTTQLIFRHSHHRTLLMKVPNTLIITTHTLFSPSSKSQNAGTYSPNRSAPTSSSLA